MSLACTVPGQNETNLAAVAHQLCLSLPEHLIARARVRDSWGKENKSRWVKNVRDFIRVEKSRNACLCKSYPSLKAAKINTDSMWSYCSRWLRRSYLDSVACAVWEKHIQCNQIPYANFKPPSSSDDTFPYKYLDTFELSTMNLRGSRVAESRLFSCLQITELCAHHVKTNWIQLWPQVNLPKHSLTCWGNVSVE